MLRWAKRLAKATARPAWSVVLLAREPAPLVLANLCWHLEAGARHVHLYLDDPEDPVAALAAGIPGVSVTPCDDAFWQRLNGGRPALQTRRQALVATLAYRATTEGWMVHLDADEFLWPPGGLEPDLAQLPPRAPWLHLPVKERCYLTPSPQNLFEGAFLSPQGAATPQDPDRAAFLSRGLSGHAAGKGVTRCGLPAELLPHAPRLAGERPPADSAQGSCVLHFDGLTPLHWIIKIMRYAAHPPGQWERFLGPHRRAQVAHARAIMADPAALRAFHDLLKHRPDTGAGAAVLPFDPAPAMHARLDDPPALDVASFDALLRQTCPEAAAFS